MIEDRPLKREPELKDIRLMMSRLIPFFEFLKEIDTLERYVWHFKYPRLSMLLFVQLVIFVFCFDPKYFLSYLLLLAMVLHS